MRLTCKVSQLDAAIAQFNPVMARHNAAVAGEQQAASEVCNAITVLTNAHDTVLGVLNGPKTDSSNCSTESCFNVTAPPGAVAFAAFGRTLRATPVPPGSAAITKRLIADTAGTHRGHDPDQRGRSTGPAGRGAERDDQRANR